jgi:hypothetical protein
MRAVHSLRLSLLLITTLAVSGCFDGDGSNGDGTRTGRLNYHGFSGLSYTTASQTGTTNQWGEFRYYPGETLSFKVGNLFIADDIPAQEFVTPLEFFANLRTALKNPSVNDQGLTTHTITEQQLLDDVPLNNLVRFLISLNWTEGVREGEGIDIRPRVIRQLNAKLPELTGPIDFSASTVDFTAGGATPSPANQLLAAICFYPADDELCEEPPTQADIDAAPIRPENEDDWDPEVEYQQDLEAKRDRIIDSVRSLDDIDADDARTYMTRELKGISTLIANRYYLSPHEVHHPASDKSIQTVKILRIGGDPQLAEISEPISTRPDNVAVNATNRQAAEVEYYLRRGTPQGESELVMSFRPDNTYRWVQKSLRVIID